LGAPSNIYLPALDYFLGNGRIPGPWTLAEGVKRIPAGHVLTVSRDGRAKLRRYWRPVGQPKIRLNAKEKIERAGELFKQSLHRRVSPDIRTGVLLSSGIDSTLIVAVLRKMLNASFDTFTFRYDEYDGNYNEVDQARATADYFGVKHHELIFRPSDIPKWLSLLLRLISQSLLDLR